MSEITLEYAGEIATGLTYLTDAQHKEYRKTVPPGCCALCKFWNQYEFPTWDDDLMRILPMPQVDWTGECRRHAPVAIGTVIDGCDPEHPLWPATRHTDSCGDFTAKS